MNNTLIDEIASKLQDWGYGTVGTDIFKGSLPETIATGCYIIAAPSPAPHMYLDTEDQVFDFWYRADHTETAQRKLRELYNLLHRRANYTTLSYHIYFSNALGSIRDADRDREGGKLLVLSVQFKCRNINNVS